MSKDKKKKKKVTYIDDGRSLADMSSVGGGHRSRGDMRGTFSDRSKTFFGAMRANVKPMLVTIGIITAAFFIMWLLLNLSLLLW